MKKMIVIALLAALCLQLFGCAAEKPASGGMGRNLMADVVAAPVDPMAADAAYANAMADFSVSLLQNSLAEGETCILSPYSVLMALAMTANGAGGQTAEQFAQAFGLPISEVNRWLYSCAQQAGSELISANALWINEGILEVNPQFLQTNADYYGAAVYQSVFDAQTASAINDWVKENTARRIPSIIDRLEEEAAMVLVNALTFDALWEAPYEPSDVHDGTFTATDGSQQSVSMLGSTENSYLSGENVTGFVKEYAGGQYSFVALLPNEGISVEDYVASLTGAGLLQLIASASQEQVFAQMPVLELETDLTLNDALQAMGIVDAFGASADFSNMGSGQVMIDSVLHKTWLKVDAEGTQAAAATAVVMEKLADFTPEKSVVLNRPYVMAIVDNTTQSIIFLGAVNSVAA